MPHPKLLARRIRFKQKWFVDSAFTINLIAEVGKIARKLPSTSQLYRFRKAVLAANSLQDIRQFLEERQEKAATRDKWCFTFLDGKRLNMYLADVFLSRVEGASTLNDIAGYRYFGLLTRNLPQVFYSDFNNQKYLIARKALLDFIDEVILLKEGLSVNEQAGTNGKVEVKYDPS